MLPLYFPDEYKQNSYGLANQPLFAYNREKIVVGFNNSPRLFSYDMENEILKTHDCKSEYYRKMVPYTGYPADQEALMNYINEKTLFISLNYIPNKSHYFLISATDKGQDPSGIRFNLTVLNEELETMCEFSLPDSLLPMHMWNAPNGLAFRASKKSTSTQSVYQVMDIDCE